MLNARAKPVSSPSLIFRQQQIHDIIIRLYIIRTRTDCVDLPRRI